MKLAQRLRRLKGDDHNDDHFWPGYVDALVNVVLNLLFLLAVLTMAAFTLGQQVGKSKQAPQIVQAIEQGIKETIKANIEAGYKEVQDWVEPISLVAQSGGRERPKLTDESALRIAEVRTIDRGKVIEVHTPKDAWNMGASNQDAFIKSLDVYALKQKKLLVWTNTDPDPQRMRQDYLRVFQMREWLIKAGVEASRINIRLIEGGTSGSSEVAPIFILMEQE